MRPSEPYRRASTPEVPGLFARLRIRSEELQGLLAHEWGLLSGLVLALFLFLVLFSYDPRDAGFFSSGNGEGILHNWGDATGAWIASFLLFLFGVFAYVVPFGVALVSWVVFRIRLTRTVVNRRQLLISSASLLLFLSTGAALASLYLNGQQWFVVLPYSGGGMWGYALSHLLVSLVDRLATTLLLLAFFLLSFSWIIGISLLHIIDLTGELLWLFWHWVLESWQDQWKPMLLRAGDWLANQYQAWRRGEAVLPTRQAAYHWLVSYWHDRWVQIQTWVQGKPKLIRPVGEPYHTIETRAQMGDTAVHSIPGLVTDEATFSNAHNHVHSLTAMYERTDRQSLDKEARSSPSMSQVEQLIAQQEFEQKSLLIDPEQERLFHHHEHSRSHAQQPIEHASIFSSTPLHTDTIEHTMTLESAAQLDAHSNVEPSTATDWQSKLRTVTPTSSTIVSEKARLPSLSLLDTIPAYRPSISDSELESMGQQLEQTLKEYNIKADVVGIVSGPVVTLFELQPAPGVKVGSITNLAKDLARSMAVLAVRVVDIIPGKSVIGIEIPNPVQAAISFREILSSDSYQQTNMILPLAMGKDTAGNPVVADLAKMPHVLVAGQTGSGKSVGVNAMIVSLLYHATADEVKFIMIDPKMLELSVYDGIPHLLAPVVTDMSEAANALRWCVVEMERRYQLMSKLGVRNIAGYNEKVRAAIDAGQPLIDPLAPVQMLSTLDMAPPAKTLEPLPYIVVIVDEFADLFMVVGKKVEELIARLAQKARAAGIHIVLATQRPSVDVVTGLIKANIPARIAFKVASKIDSRTILDQMGADQLLGRGDMLYLGNGMGHPQRVHGPFVSDEEVHRVVDFLKTQGTPEYVNLDPDFGSSNSGNASATLVSLFDDEAGGAERDALYDEAVAFIMEAGRVSVSSVQRRFRIGYNRAARLVEAMEAAGIVSAPQTNGNRDILVNES